MGQGCTSLSHSKKKQRKKEKKRHKVIETAYKGPKGSYIVKAKYKYEASGVTDISFNEMEIMYVIKEFDEFWLEVIKHNDKKQGLIPSNYVSIQDGSPRSVEAWREIPRWEAEKLLMRIGMNQGTYIIRPSRREGCFALSVRDFDRKKNIYNVKHFQIKSNANNISYSINFREFPDILTLIQYYEKYGIGNTHIELTDPLPDNYQPPIHFQDIEINRDSLELLGEIGRGCFGSVFKAKWGRSYEVAAKMLQSSKTEREIFILEAKIMHKLRHRKIVELLGVCTEPSDMPMIIIVEYMKNGSLKEYLKSEEGQKTTLEQMIHMMADITEGMAYLEGEKVVHRDLRADNILVSDDLSVKVADFGLTVILDEKVNDKIVKNFRFPYKWTAPEAVKTKIFTSKSDVWSFGVVIYEILTWGSTPYPDISPKDVIDKVSAGYRMPNPQEDIEGAKCPDELYTIMMSCWMQFPDDRPNFSVLQDQMDNIIVNNVTGLTYYCQSS